MKRKLDKARRLVCLLLLTGGLLSMFGNPENLVLTPYLGMLFALAAVAVSGVEFIYRMQIILGEEQ